MLKWCVYMGGICVCVCVCVGGGGGEWLVGFVTERIHSAHLTNIKKSMQ